MLAPMAAASLVAVLPEGGVCVGGPGGADKRGFLVLGVLQATRVTKDTRAGRVRVVSDPLGVSKPTAPGNAEKRRSFADSYPDSFQG